MNIALHSYRNAAERRVWTPEKVFWRGFPPVGGAKAEPDRRRKLNARSCAHNDFGSAEVCGIACGGVHQRKECHSSGPSVRGAEMQFCWAALLGIGVFCFGGGSGRSRNLQIDSESGAGRQAYRSFESLALAGHLLGGSIEGAAQRPRQAALSGSQIERPRLCRGMVTSQGAPVATLGSQISFAR